MKLPRRRFLHLAAGAGVLPALSRIANAQAYPARPVRIIVGFSPGGAVDITARLIGRWLSERLGQPFIVENRPGAASTVGIEAVVKAAPDGYTLLFVNTVFAISATLYDKLSFNFIRDIAPVAAISREPVIMLVNPLLSAKTVPEFVAYAKANPGKVSFGSGGIGSVAHVSGELFKAMAGVNLVHVPYRSVVPALADLIGGQVHVMFATMTASIQYIRAGSLRALAVTTATRLEALPDIPAVSEIVPGYEASAWYGVGAPKNTPVEIINLLNKEINTAIADPKIKMRFAELGTTALPGSPADFGKLIADEIEKWAKVARNIKPALTPT